MPESKKRVKKSGKNAQFRAKVREAQTKIGQYEKFVERVRVKAIQIGEYAAAATRRALSCEQLVLRIRDELKKGTPVEEVLPVIDEAVEDFFVNKELKPVGVKGEVNPELEGVADEKFVLDTSVPMALSPISMPTIDPMAGYQASDAKPK